MWGCSNKIVFISWNLWCMICLYDITWSLIDNHVTHIFRFQFASNQICLCPERMSFCLLSCFQLINSVTLTHNFLCWLIFILSSVLCTEYLYFVLSCSFLLWTAKCWNTIRLKWWTKCNDSYTSNPGLITANSSGKPSETSECRLLHSCGYSASGSTRLLWFTRVGFNFWLDTWLVN